MAATTLDFRGDTLELSKIVYVAYSLRNDSVVIVTPICSTTWYEGRRAWIELSKSLVACGWVRTDVMTVVNPDHVVLWTGDAPRMLNISNDVVKKIKRQMG